MTRSANTKPANKPRVLCVGIPVRDLTFRIEAVPSWMEPADAEPFQFLDERRLREARRRRRLVLLRLEPEQRDVARRGGPGG